MTNPSPPRPDGPRSLKAWADKENTHSSFIHRALHTLTRLILITLTEFNNNSLSLRSGAMTYTVLLSLVPILAMSTAVIKGLGGGDELRKAAYTYIESLEESTTLLPKGFSLENAPTDSATQETGKNLTGHLRSAIDQLFDYVDKTNFATLGTFGVVGMLLSIIMVLSHIESAMNIIWKVPAGRPLLRKIADYTTLLILMPLSINIAFTASAFLTNPALAAKIDIAIPYPWIQTLLLNALPIVIFAVTFYVMYIFFPNTRVRSWPAVLGSSLAAVCWFAMQNIYISLQVGVAKYNAIYGSFATFPLFLVWIYFGWVFILVGAQVAYAAQHLKEYRLIPQSVTPSLKLAAGFDVMNYIYQTFATNQVTTVDNLIESLPNYPPQIIADSVAVLKTAGMIHVSQSDKRLLPATPFEQYQAEPVVKSILGSEVPNTNGGKMCSEAVKAAIEANQRQTAPSSKSSD